MTNFRETVEDTHREHALELFIGNLLRWCVIAVVIIIAVGAALYLPAHGRDVVDYTVFRSEPESLRSVTGVVRQAFSGSASGILQFGLLFLILTPILRVALSAVAFVAEKDRLYVAMTLVVLGLLLYSLFAS
jgi:uncharacterized membrane protein